mmetsp:Transcript_18718/g.51412  ORF Transcript_18718/g.51412 Transcript_18718/m.51412 type:complete len:261 (+) Transcript_18718:570-1352(+)
MATASSAGGLQQLGRIRACNKEPCTAASAAARIAPAMDGPVRRELDDSFGSAPWSRAGAFFFLGCFPLRFADTVACVGNASSSSSSSSASSTFLAFAPGLGICAPRPGFRAGALLGGGGGGGRSAPGGSTGGCLGTASGTLGAAVLLSSSSCSSSSSSSPSLSCAPARTCAAASARSRCASVTSADSHFAGPTGFFGGAGRFAEGAAAFFAATPAQPSRLYFSAFASSRSNDRASAKLTKRHSARSSRGPASSRPLRQTS